VSNPLYNAIGNPMLGMVQRFQQFQKNFSGDPRQQVQQLLNSGRITQDQYNQAVQMAQQLQRAMNGR